MSRRCVLQEFYQHQAVAMNYQPPKVSRFFQYDWQFAVDMSKLPLLRPASLMIGFMPLILKMSVPLFGLTIISIPWTLWATWWSSVAFLASWVLLRLRCPNFIRQYRHYGEYNIQQHSHRWIVWLFYITITKLSSWQKIVQETLAKRISVRANDLEASEQFRDLPPEETESLIAQLREPSDPQTVRIFPPINIVRDLYVPIHCYGERLVLLLQEDDPKLPQKEKELFWILFSQAAKEGPCWRVAFWVLFYTSIGLTAVNVANNVIAVWWR